MFVRTVSTVWAEFLPHVVSNFIFPSERKWSCILRQQFKLSTAFFPELPSKISSSKLPVLCAFDLRSVLLGTTL